MQKFRVLVRRTHRGRLQTNGDPMISRRSPPLERTGSLSMLDLYNFSGTVGRSELDLHQEYCLKIKVPPTDGIEHGVQLNFSQAGLPRSDDLLLSPRTSRRLGRLFPTVQHTVPSDRRVNSEGTFLIINSSGSKKKLLSAKPVIGRCR